MRRATRIVLTAAAALALVGGGTAAGAAIAGPVDSGGVVHSCYTTKAVGGSHVIVLQDAGSNCPNGTTAISWNQQGPPGPKGDTGATGATGPAGPSGTSGIDGGSIQINTNTNPATCTLSNVFGPDAANITTTGVEAISCLVEGYGKNVNIQVTATDGINEFTPAVSSEAGFFEVSLMNRIGDFESGSFNWIAVPTG